MRLTLALALAAASLPLTLAAAPAIAQEQPAATEGERLNAWFDEKFEEQLQFSPFWLTSLGRRDMSPVWNIHARTRSLTFVGVISPAAA